jgi:hypothetical protein
MSTPKSFLLKSILLICILFLIGMACNFSATTNNAEANATAQARQATDQAINLKLTNASVSDPDAQATAAAQNSANQATVTAEALHILQTANALNAKATSDAYASQSNQQNAGGQSTTNTSSDVGFEVINQSAYTICRVYFSPPQASDWLVQDSLDTNIPPDYQQTFYVQPGDYDLRVDDCSGISIEEYFNVNIPAYDTWLVTGDASTSSEPLCGDGYCGDFENSGNCPQDCGSYDGPLCGDGNCGDFENSGNCPQDCGGYDGPLCGDGYCGDFENSGNCPQDCP